MSIQVVVDGQVETIAIPELGLVKDVLRRIDQWLYDRKRVALEYWVDDTHVEGDSMALVEEKSSEDVRRVEVRSVDSMDFVRDILFQLKDVFSQMNDQFKTMAVAFQTAQTREGLKALQSGANVVKFALKNVGNCLKFLNRFYPGIALREVDPFTRKIDKVLKRLEDMTGILNEGDYVALADFLEYELAQEMTDWRNYVDLLLGYLDRSIADETVQG